MPTINLPHLNYCLTDTHKIQNAVMWGGIFSGIDFLQGARLTPTSVGSYMGFIWLYGALQCPMEAIHNRRSLWHNVIAGGTLGSLGVHAGRIGIPFVDSSIFYRYPQLRPWQVGFVVYGGMGGVLGALGNKQF